MRLQLLQCPEAVAAFRSPLCMGSIALDVVAAVAVSGGCGCLPLAFTTRHLQCAAEELLLQELAPSYCGGRGWLLFSSDGQAAAGCRSEDIGQAEKKSKKQF